MWHVVKLILAALLATTAILKIASMKALLGTGGFISSPGMLGLATAFEFGVAVFILLASARVGHVIATGTFLLLFSVAGWSWWTQRDCSCFGPQTPKGLPVIIDLGCLALLAFSSKSAWKTNSQSSMRHARHFTLLRAGSLSLAVGVGIGIIVCYLGHHALEQRSIPLWLGENLVGKRFPLFGDEMIPQQVAGEGEWLLIFTRTDCDHCVEFIEQHAVTLKSANNLRILGISMSPDTWVVAPNALQVDPQTDGLVQKILWNEVDEPFVAAPLVVAMRDEMVIRAFAGEDAIDFAERKEWFRRIFDPVKSR